MLILSTVNCNLALLRVLVVLLLRLDAFDYNAMYFKCCVRNCANTRKDAILHKFPSNEDRLDKWLLCLKNNFTRGSSIKNLFVCQRHFEKRFITENLKLTTGAYPTLFNLDEIASGIPDNKGM